jgi:hypothetical protein
LLEERAENTQIRAELKVLKSEKRKCIAQIKITEKKPVSIKVQKTETKSNSRKGLLLLCESRRKDCESDLAKAENAQ